MKKTLLGLGAIASTIAPITSVIACGYETPDKAPYELISRKDSSTETQLNFIVKLKGYISESYIKEIKSRIAETLNEANKDELKYTTISISFQDAKDELKREAKWIGDHELVEKGLDAVLNFMGTKYDNLVTAAKANIYLYKFFVESITDGLGGTGTSTSGTGSGSTGGSGGNPTPTPQPITTPQPNPIPIVHHLSASEKRKILLIANAFDIKENGGAITTKDLFGFPDMLIIRPDKIQIKIKRTTVAATGEVTINNLHDASNSAVSIVSGDTLEFSLPFTKNNTVDFTKATFTITHAGTSSSPTFVATNNDLLNKLILELLKEQGSGRLNWDFSNMANPQTTLNKYLSPILINPLQVNNLGIRLYIDLAHQNVIDISIKCNITSHFDYSLGRIAFEPGDIIFHILLAVESYNPSSATPFVFKTGPHTEALIDYSDASTITTTLPLDHHSANVETEIREKITQLYKDLFTF